MVGLSIVPVVIVVVVVVVRVVVGRCVVVVGRCVLFGSSRVFAVVGRCVLFGRGQNIKHFSEKGSLSKSREATFNGILHKYFGPCQKVQTRQHTFLEREVLARS